MKHICKHCQCPCKKSLLTDCDKYNAKANKPKQLEVEIKQAYADGNIEKAKKLQLELDKFLYG